MKRLVLACVVTTILSGCQLTASQKNAASEKSTPERPEYTLEEGLKRYALVPTVSATESELDEELTPQQQADLWDRIRMQMQFDIPDNQAVTSHRDWYLRHPGYIDRVSARAAPFLHMIVDEIEKRDLPLELVLIPIVESAYDTFAYSHGRASGIWQFIPSTARHYGLDINWWYDGRRDVLAATETALDYFARLHATFDGDWLLALAAYNAGQGRVANAVRRNARQGKPTDFWSLSLPRETRNYVPKILALADLLQRGHEYDIAWRYIPNQPVLEVIDAGQQIDLALAAEMSGMDLETLHRFNSGYNRWATAPEGPHHLIMPTEYAVQFRQALTETDPSQWLAWERHQIGPGESLSTIARRYRTTVDTIQRFNNLNGTMIRQGDHLLIPVASESDEHYTLSAEQRLASTQDSQQGKRIDHSVKSGDTLWDISRKYGVSVANIARWNNMAPGDMLRPGQTLAIYTGQSSSTTSTIARSSIQNNGEPVIRTVQYRVRSGDSLARIANRFRVTISDIEQWNSISRDNYLQPGQQLKLRVNVAEVSL